MCVGDLVECQLVVAVLKWLGGVLRARGIPHTVGQSQPIQPIDPTSEFLKFEWFDQLGLRALTKPAAGPAAHDTPPSPLKSATFTVLGVGASSPANAKERTPFKTDRPPLDAKYADLWVPPKENRAERGTSSGKQVPQQVFARSFMNILRPLGDGILIADAEEYTKLTQDIDMSEANVFPMHVSDDHDHVFYIPFPPGQRQICEDVSAHIDLCARKGIVRTIVISLAILAEDYELLHAHAVNGVRFPLPKTSTALVWLRNFSNSKMLLLRFDDEHCPEKGKFQSNVMSFNLGRGRKSLRSHKTDNERALMLVFHSDSGHPLFGVGVEDPLEAVVPSQAFMREGHNRQPRYVGGGGNKALSISHMPLEFYNRIPWEDSVERPSTFTKVSSSAYSDGSVALSVVCDKSMEGEVLELLKSVAPGAIPTSNSRDLPLPKANLIEDELAAKAFLLGIGDTDKGAESFWTSGDVDSIASIMMNPTGFKLFHYINFPAMFCSALLCTGGWGLAKLAADGGQTLAVEGEERVGGVDIIYQSIRMQHAADGAMLPRVFSEVGSLFPSEFSFFEDLSPVSITMEVRSYYSDRMSLVGVAMLIQRLLAYAFNQGGVYILPKSVCPDGVAKTKTSDHTEGKLKVIVYVFPGGESSQYKSLADFVNAKIVDCSLVYSALTKALQVFEADGVHLEMNPIWAVELSLTAARGNGKLDEDDDSLRAAYLGFFAQALYENVREHESYRKLAAIDPLEAHALAVSIIERAVASARIADKSSGKTPNAGGRPPPPVLLLKKMDSPELCSMGSKRFFVSGGVGTAAVSFSQSKGRSYVESTQDSKKFREVVMTGHLANKKLSATAAAASRAVPRAPSVVVSNRFASLADPEDGDTDGAAVAVIPPRPHSADTVRPAIRANPESKAVGDDATTSQPVSGGRSSEDVVMGQPCSE